MSAAFLSFYWFLILEMVHSISEVEKELIKLIGVEVYFLYKRICLLHGVGHP